MIVVLVGTGTDVGKTHVSCALARAVRDRGDRVVAWKPIASGADAAGGDAAALADAVGGTVLSPLYSFAEPISPHLAARRVGVTIELAPIAARAAELARGSDVAIVETAGGLFSPLDRGVANADLVRAIAGARVVLVAPDRIGVLHDVRATLLAAASVGVVVDALALSAPAIADASTGTNAGEIEDTLERAVAASFPREAWTTRPSLDAAAAILAVLARG